MNTSRSRSTSSRNILVVTPVPAGSLQGNRVTAMRWVKMLRAARHHVTIADDFHGQPCDILIALHAYKSAKSIALFARQHPNKPLVVSLTGTDLYGDIRTKRTAARSLKLATRLTLLQAHGLNELPREFHAKARVIVQSAVPPKCHAKPLASLFEVCVSGHLRAVKDPFRAAMASRRLPPNSKIQITHLGSALAPSYEQRARAEMDRNPRYRWLGEVSRARAATILSRSRVLALTSKSEGGANVISEAIVARTPVIASRISGSIGLLGESYSGYYNVGDTQQLTALMLRCEQDAGFYQQLQRECDARAPMFHPTREHAAWAALIDELE